MSKIVGIILAAVLGLLLLGGVGYWVTQPFFSKLKAEREIGKVETKVSDVKGAATKETANAEIKTSGAIAKVQTKRAAAVAVVNSANDSDIDSAFLDGVCNSSVYYDDPACDKYRRRLQGYGAGDRAGTLLRGTAAPARTGR